MRLTHMFLIVLGAIGTLLIFSAVTSARGAPEILAGIIGASPGLWLALKAEIRMWREEKAKVDAIADSLDEHVANGNEAAFVAEFSGGYQKKTKWVKGSRIHPLSGEVFRPGKTPTWW